MSLNCLITHRLNRNMIHFTCFVSLFVGIFVQQRVVESNKIKQNFVDFKRVFNSLTYVDKTMLLDHFIRDEDHMVITAPKGFGKTSILNMVYAFLNIPTDESGNVLDKNSSAYYKIFTTSTKIATCPKLVNKNFGRFPVLILNFSEIDTRDATTFLDSFRRFIHGTLSRFSFLESSMNLTSVDKFKFSVLRTSVKNLDLSSLIGFGKILTRMLFEHFQTKCILLIDDYDVPISEALESKNATGSDSIINSLALFVGRMIKRNEKFVARSLLTGCRKLGAKHLATACNLHYYSVFDESPYWEFYGLTECEIEVLISKFNIPLKSLGLSERDSVFDGNHRLYNTSSVLKKLKQKVD